MKAWILAHSRTNALPVVTTLVSVSVTSIAPRASEVSVSVTVALAREPTPDCSLAEVVHADHLRPVRTGDMWIRDITATYRKQNRPFLPPGQRHGARPSLGTTREKKTPATRQARQSRYRWFKALTTLHHAGDVGHVS
jgi:hypothetical protein